MAAKLKTQKKRFSLGGVGRSSKSKGSRRRASSRQAKKGNDRMRRDEDGFNRER